MDASGGVWYGAGTRLIGRDATGRAAMSSLAASSAQDGPGLGARFQESRRYFVEGTLVIADARNGAIHRVTPDGRVTLVGTEGGEGSVLDYPTVQRDRPERLDLRSPDAFNHRLVAFSLAGSRGLVGDGTLGLTDWRLGLDKSGFRLPAGLALSHPGSSPLGPTGEIYLSERDPQTLRRSRWVAFRPPRWSIRSIESATASDSKRPSSRSRWRSGRTASSTREGPDRSDPADAIAAVT